MFSKRDSGLSTFGRLSPSAKYNAVIAKGNFIARRSCRGMEAHLYKVENVYVEVWKGSRLNEVMWIEVVPESALRKYSTALQIEELMQ